MASTSSTSLLDPRAYHIICYSTFVGTTFFQSFVAGPVGFKTLPRAMFGRLQQTTTPVFFAIQTALSIGMILTYPGERSTSAGLLGHRVHAGWSGLMADSNLWTITIPLLVILVTSAANLVVLGPATTKTMKLRHHQETRDGKKSYDAGPHSPEMAALNKRFGMLHGASSLLDLVGYIASLYYGFILGARI
ncbi:hypothetical protein K461DRAFT_218444 [Myriangium duriaei CBS 260.36]|uniref:TMEM205-like domain-containing protein n=1 Tax=Myriangium duriaei CBS 260.36 TaxID=1168546 RepID=A0A9P4MS20_9PEZI|nr:hypothetical protein K461DRAFT_218444 [Myriangium duriaei CBS 260.36]